VRYYSFLARHEALYRANRPHGDVLLLFPRGRVHEGDVFSVNRFKELGERLLDAHVLFDILPDDRATPAIRARYATVVSNTFELPPDLSYFEAPTTVRVSASRPEKRSELTLHFVNYNREELPDKKDGGKGIKDEKPTSVPSSQADLKLAPKQQAARLEFLTPEAEEAKPLEFQQVGDRLRFRVPEFLVYGVVRIQLSK